MYSYRVSQLHPSIIVELGDMQGMLGAMAELSLVQLK